MKSSTARHIRDIRNLCGADMVVYEKQTKSLWFSLWNFPFRWKLKQSHNVFWLVVRQLPQTHAWLACWQCRTLVKFIYCWHRWNIYQPFEFNIINDNIYMQNTHMGLSMNTRRGFLQHSPLLLIFLSNIDIFITTVMYNCLVLIPCHVLSLHSHIFPWWAGENIPAAKDISSLEKKNLIEGRMVSCQSDN